MGQVRVVHMDDEQRFADVRAFFEDLATLRIEAAEHYPRATEHIPEMIDLASRLRANGHTYESQGSLYFRIASFAGYGSLSHLDRREIRVGARQTTNLEPFPRIGDLVNEVSPFRPGAPLKIPETWDDHKAQIVRAEPNIQLFLNTRVCGVEKDGDRIRAVVAKHVTSGKEQRFVARVFADCTGDGTVGFLAGADFRMGRESWEQTGETMAPKVPDAMTMGASVQWYTIETLRPAPFPECPWALPFTEASCEHATRGDWNWETGLNKDQIADFESIRDHALRAVYGNWSF